MQTHNHHTNSPSEAGRRDASCSATTDSVNELAEPEHSRVPIHSAPGSSKRLAVAVGLIAVCLAVGYFVRHRQNAAAEASLANATRTMAQAPIAVDVVRVAYAPSSSLLSFPGDAEAWYQSTIYARVSGYVGSWSADIGQAVKKGQVLAKIDTPDLDQQLIAARAKLMATKAEVVVAQSAADFAKTSYDRWRGSPAGVVSEQEREAKKAEYDSGVAKLGAAKAQVSLDEAQVKGLQAMEQFKDVTAPFDGTITTRRLDIGDLVTAGSTASTSSLYDVAQYDTIRVFVDVPQSAAAEISDGMPATAVARQLPARKFVGTVARTSRSIDPASKTLHVEVDIQNKDLVLLPGMYLNVSFQLNQAMPRLSIPASALTFRSGGPQVAVVGPDGMVQFHGVTIARDMGDSIEIGSGLSAGDRVALNISDQIANGDRVSVNEVGTAGTPAAPAIKKATAVAGQITMHGV